MNISNVSIISFLILVLASCATRKTTYRPPDRIPLYIGQSYPRLLTVEEAHTVKIRPHLQSDKNIDETTIQKIKALIGRIPNLPSYEITSIRQYPFQTDAFEVHLGSMIVIIEQGTEWRVKRVFPI